MDTGRSCQDRLPRTTRCRRPTMTLLPLCLTFLALKSISDAASISPRLPTHVVMTAVIVVKQDPLNLDQLSLSWESKGRPLVEYKDNKIISYEPRALLPQEKFNEGNFSLILINITMKDTGNYTCRIEYERKQDTIYYNLQVERHKIRLIDLSKKVDETNDRNEQKNKLMKRSSNKSAQQSNPQSSTTSLRIGGYQKVMATPGENISLMCRFHTDPSMELTMLDIRWSKDGVTKWVFNKDSEVDDAKLEELSRGNASLKLTSIQKTDSGRYTCRIKYRSWDKSLHTNVIVKDKVDPTESTIANLKHEMLDKVDPTESTIANLKHEMLGIYLPNVTSSFIFYQKYKVDPTESTIASTDKYRKEKVGMVVGVVVIANFLVYSIYFCIAL